MSVALYMDVHVRRAVTNGLRMRGVDVITAREDGTAMWPDDRLLDRAGELGRVLFSQDDDLLAEAELRQREGRDFAGVIHAHQLAITIGQLRPGLGNHRQGRGTRGSAKPGGVSALVNPLPARQRLPARSA